MEDAPVLHIARLVQIVRDADIAAEEAPVVFVEEVLQEKVFLVPHQNAANLKSQKHPSQATINQTILKPGSHLKLQQFLPMKQIAADILLELRRRIFMKNHQ